MRKRILPSLALAAAATLALGPGHARAANVSTNQIGDLFLGFEASGSPDDLEVDLGPITNFLNATSPFQVTFGLNPTTSTAVTNLNSDLAIFNGSGTWQTNTALNWGLVGLTPDSSHFYVFLSQDAVDTTPPIDPASTFAESGETSSIKSILGSQGLAGYSNDGYSTAAADAPTGDDNSWTSFTPSGNGLQTGYDLEQQNGDSAIGSTLNLFELTPAGGGSGQDVGAFTLDSSGDLTFTPASVPEPTTWASILSGAAVLAFFRRRSVRVS